jgi:hypothetical protein
MVIVQMQQSLEELLVKTKLISPPQLAVAQRDAAMRKRPLAHTLIDLGFVNDRKFAEWVAGVTNLPIVDPLRPEVISDIEGHVPSAVAREHQVVPIDVEADEMTIATVDPLDRASIDAIQSATGMKIHPVIGIRGQLAEMVQRFYPIPPEFDPSKTIAAPLEPEPFAFGDDTMLRHHSLEFAFAGGGDVSLGSETRVLPATAPEHDTNPVPDPAAPAKPPEMQLDRIERHLSDLVQAIEALQRRIDAIDSTLARVLNRQT